MQAKTEMSGAEVTLPTALTLTSCVCDHEEKRYVIPLSLSFFICKVRKLIEVLYLNEIIHVKPL